MSKKKELKNKRVPVCMTPDFHHRLSQAAKFTMQDMGPMLLAAGLKEVETIEKKMKGANSGTGH